MFWLKVFWLKVFWRKVLWRKVFWRKVFWRKVFWRKVNWLKVTPTLCTCVDLRSVAILAQEIQGKRIINSLTYARHPKRKE